MLNSNVTFFFVWRPVSDRELPTPLGFPVIRTTKVSLVMLMGWPLENPLGASGPNTLALRRWSSITHGQWSINHAYLVRPPWNPKRQGAESLPVGEHMERGYRAHVASTGGSQTLPMDLALCVTSIWPFADRVPLYETSNLVSLAEFWELPWQTDCAHKAGSGNLWFVASRSEAQVMTCACHWRLQWGQCCGTEPCPAGSEAHPT